VDFAERFTDSERSTRPAAFDVLRHLATSGDDDEAWECPGCHALFCWYRCRDSDAGETSQTIRRCEGTRAASLLLDVLSRPSTADRAWAVERLRRLALPPSPLQGPRFDKDALATIITQGAAAGGAELAQRVVADGLTELGGHALVALGAFDVLEREAEAGAQAAVNALARSGPPSCAPLLARLLQTATNPLLRMPAAAGLGRLGLEQRLLSSTLRTAQDTQIVNACRDALAAMGAARELIALLDDASWSVRRAAAEGLGEASGDVTAAVAALEAAVLRPGNVTIAITAAVRALRSFGRDAASVEVLLDRLEERGEPDGLRAVASLRA
jgi:hypothetical protein